MKAIKQFQVRGIPGQVSRISIGDRIIDYWAPKTPTDSLLLAHDGQNVFDGKTSTHRRKTWEIGQSVNRVSAELGNTPPAVIAIWNGNTKADPYLVMYLINGKIKQCWITQSGYPDDDGNPY